VTVDQVDTHRKHAHPHLRRLITDRAAGIDQHGTAIEDQLILAADLVDIDDRHPPFARARRQHIVAALLLAAMKRRSIEIDHQARARAGRTSSGFRPPDVLADGDGGGHTAEIDHTGRIAGGKIALLVEHLVIGQTLLVVAGDQLAIADHAGRVIEPVTLAPRITEHRDDAAAGRHYHLQSALDAGLQRRPQQQILGRIADQRQLGEHGDLGTVPIAGGAQRGDDLLRIPRDIADQGVELRQRDSEPVHETETPSSGRAAILD